MSYMQTKKILFTLFLVSFVGSSSFVFSSGTGGGRTLGVGSAAAAAGVDERTDSERRDSKAKAHTNEIFKKCLKLLEERSTPENFSAKSEAFLSLMRSGFARSLRNISDRSGVRFRMNLDYLLHMLKNVKGKRVAVLGCSSGEEGLLALLFGALEVVLNDIDESELGRAHALCKGAQLDGLCTGRLTILKGDCLRARLFRQEKFDYILAHNLIHFFNPRQMLEFKKMISGMIKGGSYLYMTANPCTYPRHLKLTVLRNRKPHSEEIKKTIGVFPKRSLLKINCNTRKQTVIIVDPGYDAPGEKFYSEDKFPHVEALFSRPLPGTFQAYKDPMKVMTFEESMLPFIMKNQGLDSKEKARNFVEGDFQLNEALVGTSDSRLRRVFSVRQLAEVFVTGDHDLFDLESSGLVNVQATAFDPALQDYGPVQDCREVGPSNNWKVPKDFLGPARQIIYAQPCVILKARELHELEPLPVIGASEAELRRALRGERVSSAASAATE